MEHPTKDLVTKFGKLYRDKIGERYPPTWGRDQKIFKDLLNEYSEERLEEFLELYFSLPQKIYSIPFFRASLGDLIQTAKRIEREKPKAMPEGENWRFE